MSENPPPNRNRRAGIIMGCLAVTIAGLIYLNMLSAEELTSINTLTAEGLIEVFIAIVVVYVLGSAGGTALEKLASRAPK